MTPWSLDHSPTDLGSVTCDRDLETRWKAALDEIAGHRASFRLHAKEGRPAERWAASGDLPRLRPGATYLRGRPRAARPRRPPRFASAPRACPGPPRRGGPPFWSTETAFPRSPHCAAPRATSSSTSSSGRVSPGGWPESSPAALAEVRALRALGAASRPSSRPAGRPSRFSSARPPPQRCLVATPPSARAAS